MSWLQLLEDDSVSDTELLQQVTIIEENLEFPDDSLTDSQCVAGVIAAEELDNLWSDMSNSEVLDEVMKTESSLEPLLCPDAMTTACVNLSKYQGPSIPMPIL